MIELTDENGNTVVINPAYIVCMGRTERNGKHFTHIMLQVRIEVLVMESLATIKTLISKVKK